MPKLTDWGMFFEEKHGRANRLKVLHDFVEFLKDPEATTMTVDGNYMLGGIVTGHKRLIDNKEIFTSDVLSLEKIEVSRDRTAPHDLLCATTINGTKYYFYTDHSSKYIRNLLGDYLINDGKIDETPELYIPERLRTGRFL